MLVTGMSLKSLDHWLINARRRYLKVKAFSKSLGCPECSVYLKRPDLAFHIESCHEASIQKVACESCNLVFINPLLHQYHQNMCGKSAINLFRLTERDSEKRVIKELPQFITCTSLVELDDEISASSKSPLELMDDEIFGLIRRFRRDSAHEF